MEDWAVRGESRRDALVPHGKYFEDIAMKLGLPMILAMSLGVSGAGADEAAKKMCYAPPGKDRPKEFGAKEGTGYTFSEWQREKK